MRLNRHPWTRNAKSTERAEPATPPTGSAGTSRSPSGPIHIDVILGADGQVVGVHVDGCGAYFVLEEPYVHSMPMDSGWRVRRYTAETNTWPDGSPIDQVAS
jgi:hypothetical protein